MDFYLSLSDLMICMIEGAIYYDFFRGIMSYRIENRVYRMLILSGMFGVVWIVNSAHNSLLNLFAIFAISILLNFILYQGPLGKRCLYIVLMELITLRTEFASEAVFVSLLGREEGGFLNIRMEENRFEASLTLAAK